MTYRTAVFSGVRWTTFSSLVSAVLQLLQMVILARFLSPVDFGLMAVVMAILAFLQIFSDVGVSNALIHHQDITANQLSSLYWLNVTASVILAFFVVALSPWIASFYAQSALGSLLMLATLGLVISSLGQQLRVVAQKNLRFVALAKVELSSALISFVAAVSVALLDGGVYALLAGSLSAAAAGSILAWWVLAEGWRPKLRLHLDEIRCFLTFGAYTIVNNLANTVNSQIDVLLGARLLGAQSIGLYSVPKTLALRVAGVINPIITRIGLPVMAKIQGDVALLKKIYLQTLRMTASVNFPIYVAMGAFAQEVVQVVLGSQWETAVPLFQILTAWALLRSIFNPLGSLVMAVGRPDLELKWNIALMLAIPPAVWSGSQWGVQGMAYALLGVYVLLFVPAWYFLVRPLCGAKFLEYSFQLMVPLALSLIAGLIGYLSANFLTAPSARLALGLAAGGISYLLLSYVFNKIWYHSIIELLGARSGVKKA